MQRAGPDLDVMTCKAHRAITLRLHFTTIKFHNFRPCYLQAIPADHRSMMPFDARQSHCPDRTMTKVTQDVLWLHILGISSLTVHGSALLQECH